MLMQCCIDVVMHYDVWPACKLHAIIVVPQKGFYDDMLQSCIKAAHLMQAKVWASATAEKTDSIDSKQENGKWHVAAHARLHSNQTGLQLLCGAAPSHLQD